MDGVETVFIHSSGSVQFGVFLEPDPQGLLQLTYYVCLGSSLQVMWGIEPHCFFLHDLILGINKHAPHGIGRLVIHGHTVLF